MSLLNLHSGLLELFDRFDLVYSPLVDTKDYPEEVDIVLVEGAVANEENLKMARLIRERSRMVVSFGDCAVTGNITALRNPAGKKTALAAAYPGCDTGSCFGPDVPRLLDEVLPLHQVIHVDAFIPGCPPTPAAINEAISKIAGRLV